MTRPDVHRSSTTRPLRVNGAHRPEHLSAEDIKDAARHLVADIEARADEGASLRRMPMELVTRLQAAGVFRMAMPRSRGGPQMTPRQQLEVIELLSTADPSVGWCVRAGIAGGFLSARLSAAAAAELFPSLDAVTAGDLLPSGHAVRVDGGYRVSGRWGFASGCTHASVMYAQCEVIDDVLRHPKKPNRPTTRVMIAPASRWQILDTWYTTGLAGSGSHDFTAHDLFIPEIHTVGFQDSPLGLEPLYASDTLLTATLTGVPLGLARRAIDSLRALVDRKGAPPSARSAGLPSGPGVRSALAQAESLLGAARAYACETLDAAWERLSTGAPLTKELHLALGLSRVHAFRAGREVAQLMFNTAGAAAVYARSPLDRLLRDAITIAQHAAGQEGNLEVIGRALLDEDAPAPML